MLDKNERPYMNTSAAIEYHGKSKSDVKPLAIIQILMNRAAFIGDVQCLKCLKDSGAGQLSGLRLQEAMIPALENHQDDAAIFLLEWGGKELTDYVDPENKDTLLHMAAFRGQAKICQKILDTDENLDVNAKNKSKSTALHCAVASGNIDTVRVLVDAGASIKSKNDHKNTAMTLARLHNQQEILNLLENKKNTKITSDGPSQNDPLAPSQSDRISRIE